MSGGPRAAGAAARRSDAGRLCHSEAADRARSLTVGLHIVDPVAHRSPPREAHLLRGDLALQRPDTCDDLLALVLSGACLDDCDYDRRTVLHLAASEGQLEAARFLIDAGAEIAPIDRWGNTPLKDAVMHKRDNLASLLRSHGGDATDKEHHSTATDVAVFLSAAAAGELEQRDELDAKAAEESHKTRTSALILRNPVQSSDSAPSYPPPLPPHIPPHSPPHIPLRLLFMPFSSPLHSVRIPLPITPPVSSSSLLIPHPSYPSSFPPHAPRLCE